MFLYSCCRSIQVAFAVGAEKGKGVIGHTSARQCYSDMGIPIPKTLVIWAFLSHISLAIWIRVTREAHIIRILGMGMPKTGDAHVTVTLGRRGTSPFARLRPQGFSLVKIPFPFQTPVMQVKEQTISELPLSQDEVLARILNIHKPVSKTYRPENDIF